MNGTGIKAHIGAETVPPVGDIPTEPKAFERWLRRMQYAHWEPDLIVKAVRALNALGGPQQSIWDDDYALRKQCKREWQDFITDPRIVKYQQIGAAYRATEAV